MTGRAMRSTARPLQDSGLAVSLLPSFVGDRLAHTPGLSARILSPNEGEPDDQLLQ